MQMQLNGWNQFERQVQWSDVFHYVEDLWLYLLLKIVEIVKDGVPFKEIMLNLGQYVRTINLLCEGLWFFNMKKRNFYSHYRIHSSIKRLEKLGLITAELLPHGFLFTVSGMEESAVGRKLAEMEEASTVKEQSKNRQNLFF
ncbi:MAG: hypothetical protein ACQEUD_20385 [Bacillota bacterium]